MIEPTAAESLTALGICLAVLIGGLLLIDAVGWLGHRIVRWAEDRVARDLEAGLRYPLDQPTEPCQGTNPNVCAAEGCIGRTCRRRKPAPPLDDPEKRPMHHWRPGS